MKYDLSKEYRSCVVDRFSKEVDHQIMYNIKQEEIEEKIVKIKKIIFSGPATIVLWQGGGKTIVKYHKEKGCAYRKDLNMKDEEIAMSESEDA